MMPSGIVQAAIRWVATKTVGGTTQSVGDQFDTMQAFANGTGANQANAVYQLASQTVATSSNQDIDLYGTLTDAFGATLQFASITGIMVINQSAVANITVGGATASWTGLLVDATDKIQVCAGGGFFCAYNPSSTGWAVTATTADILRLTNQNATYAASVDVCIIGRIVGVQET